MGEKKWATDNGRSVMLAPDRRKRGRLTRRLVELAEDVMDPEDLLDPDTIELRRKNGRWTMPDCANCEDRCCIHKGKRMGILLSLADIAHLVDSGFEDLIIGTYTFRKNKAGEILPDIDEMPRLAKRQGYCIFYDENRGICTGYDHRPTICRRYPFEVEYERGSEKPFARYIPDAPCAKVHGKEYAPAIAEMVREAAIDENITLEDAELLPDYHEELRELGFEKWLPPPEECPPPEPEED